MVEITRPAACSIFASVSDEPAAVPHPAAQLPTRAPQYVPSAPAAAAIGAAPLATLAPRCAVRRARE